jgi:hypothetical protein
MNTDALKSTAASVVDNLTNAELGPFFMRLGQGLGQAAGYRPKGQISLKEIAADVLSEFYDEALAAFQAAKISLRSSANQFLSEQGLEEGARTAILDTVDKAFTDPSREEMTRAAIPHTNLAVTPGTVACFGLIAGMALGLIALRHPIFMAACGIIASGLSYSVARGKLRDKAAKLLTHLPQDIYNLLRHSLIANETRYIELVNQSLH